MNESKHKKKHKVAPSISYSPPTFKIWTKEQLFATDCVASVYTKDIAGLSIPQLKYYIQNTCKSVKLNPQFVYSRHHIGDLVSHRAVNKELKKVVMSSVPYVLNNGHIVTNWGCKPDPKNLIDRMQSCLYGAPIMIDDVKYLCLLTVKFNHLTGKIFPYVVNLEDENGMKVSDDIMVNNNNTTTPSNSDTSMGAVTSQDNRTPSNPTANVQQNIETTKDNSIKTENKQYKTNTNMNKKQIRLTESDLHRIVKESVKKVLNEKDGYDRNLKNTFKHYWKQVEPSLLKYDDEADFQNNQLKQMIYNAMWDKPEEADVLNKHIEYSDKNHKIFNMFAKHKIDKEEYIKQVEMIQQEYANNEKRFKEIWLYYYNFIKKAAVKRQERYNNLVHSKSDPLQDKWLTKLYGTPDEQYERWLGQQQDKEAREWSDPIFDFD